MMTGKGERELIYLLSRIADSLQTISDRMASGTGIETKEKPSRKKKATEDTL